MTDYIIPAYFSIEKPAYHLESLESTATLTVMVVRTGYTGAPGAVGMYKYTVLRHLELQRCIILPCVALQYWSN